MLNNFKLHIENDYDAMSAKAAAIFAERVKVNPTGAYGFATGSTPIGMYEALASMHQSKKIDLSGITAFNLDEYYPIQPNNDQSYAWFMRYHLFNAINLAESRRNIPSGTTPDPESECKNYDSNIIKAGGIDTQILGIGNNGHIGFNEPASELNAATSYISLTESTIEANSRNFSSPKDVPRHALTMGMHGIMMARCIILLASGEGKAQILRDALCGALTTMVPASLLQVHQNVYVIADRAAAKFL